MTRRVVLIAVCSLLFAADDPVPSPPLTPDQARDLTQQLRRGQTMERVKQLLGPPDRIARQVLLKRHLEQWIYPAPLGVRVVFDCRRGEEAFVLHILQTP